MSTEQEEKPLHIGEFDFAGAEANQGAEGLLPAWEEEEVHWQGRERERERGKQEVRPSVSVTDAPVSIPTRRIGSKFSGSTRLPPRRLPVEKIRLKELHCWRGLLIFCLFCRQSTTSVFCTTL